MEGDSEARKLAEEHHSTPGKVLEFIENKRQEFESKHNEKAERHVAFSKYKVADTISRSCVKPKTASTQPLSDRADAIICHKFLGPVILVGVIYLLYYLSIVQGYNITNYTWPLLAKFRSITESFLPNPGFIEAPLIRSMTLWFVDSINALLNYIPIFFILFGLIAILEDSGYMPRMAFILDRIFNKFGLHGQSTLPMVLGGIYVGGCAVPGVMSCKGIPDERARFATILTIPMLNCLAKVPLYVLMINIYFAEHKGLAMFFISTISLLMVLPVAKILTLTVLKDKDTAPFIMEMPPYHIPTIRGVLGRAVERVWLFIRKIITIVAAIAIIIFILLQFPGLSDERKAYYDTEMDRAIAGFYQKIEGGNPYAEQVQGENLMALVLYWDKYKNAKMMAKGKEAASAVNEKFKAENPVFFKIVRPKKDKEAKNVNKAFKKVFSARKKLLREIRKEKIDNSFLGRLGRSMEPYTKYAGFNWRVNVSLLASFAAKESSVATLGALYEQEEEGESLETRMDRGEKGFTPLHALALMLFMVLYPPCVATSIMVKIQTGQIRWMMFSMIFPIVLGIAVATLIFSGGTFLELSGLQAMFAFYGLALAITIGTGFLKNKQKMT